jgi:hypothetical protein
MSKTIKILLVLIVVIFISIFNLRLFSTEDEWVCSNDQWVRHGNPASLQPQTGCGKVTINTDTNFDEMGHFVKDNPGLKPNVWYLVYEKPGAPAMTIELVFDSGSVCIWGEKLGICPDVFLPRSSLTRVRGVLIPNGAVRVVDAR